MFDTFSLREEEVVELIQARYGHASIVLGDNLFAFGGMINESDYVGSIEMLNLLTKLAWTVLIEHDEKVQRTSAAVAAISANKIIVYGGLLVDRYKTSNGYLLDVSNKQLKPVLGKADDLKFRTVTQT